MGIAGRGRGRGWVGAAVLERWAAADMESTSGTGKGRPVGGRDRPASLGGERKEIYAPPPPDH